MNVATNDAWLKFLISPAARKLAMATLELDGYLTGVVVSPEMIRPARWIDPLWRDDAPFDDEDQVQVAVSGIMAQHNGILRELDRSLERVEAGNDCDYRPSFVTGANKPTRSAVRIWMKGFWHAMAMAPAGWTPFIGDERGRLLMAPLVAFLEINGETPLKSAENIDELLDDAWRFTQIQTASASVRISTEKAPSLR